MHSFVGKWRFGATKEIEKVYFRMIAAVYISDTFEYDFQRITVVFVCDNSSSLYNGRSTGKSEVSVWMMSETTEQIRHVIVTVR